jgi:hypothetical protein
VGLLVAFELRLALALGWQYISSYLVFSVYFSTVLLINV